MIQRDRMTERISPSLLRIEMKRAARPLIMLAIGFGVALLAAQYILSNINGGVGATRTIKVQVADATGVVPQRAEVRFEGIGAGTVQNVDLAGGHAVLTATVATKFGPIYKNATIAVRPNTALQDMYLDVISRGTPGAGSLTSRDVVPVDQTQSPVSISDVLNVFQPGVRAHMYNVLNQLGNGLQDRGAMLRRAFVDLAPLLRIAGRVSDQLAVRAEVTKQLVHNAGTLSSVLAQRTGQLQNVVLAGTKTLQALSTQGGVPLQQTLAELPGTLAAIPRTTDAVNRLLVRLDPAITALNPVADRLPSALADLRSFAASANPAVVALRTPVVRLVPLSRQLKPFSAALASSLTEIKPQTGYVHSVTTDLVACKQTLYEFFNWNASVFKFQDPFGTYSRGDFGFGVYTVPTMKDPQVIAGPGCAGGVTIGGVPTPAVGMPTPATPGPPQLKAAFP
jgi:ABC-type transporter Mla subunit MlaD